MLDMELLGGGPRCGQVQLGSCMLSLPVVNMQLRNMQEGITRRRVWVRQGVCGLAVAPDCLQTKCQQQRGTGATLHRARIPTFPFSTQPHPTSTTLPRLFRNNHAVRVWIIGFILVVPFSLNTFSSCRHDHPAVSPGAPLSSRRTKTWPTRPRLRTARRTTSPPPQQQAHAGRRPVGGKP